MQIPGLRDFRFIKTAHIATPLVNMFFMIGISAVIMGEKKILGTLQTLVKVLNGAHYLYITLLFLFCVVSAILPSWIVSIFRDPYLMTLVEGNGTGTTGTMIAVTIGFSILSFLVTMVIICIPSAAAIYTVRSVINPRSDK